MENFCRNSFCPCWVFVHHCKVGSFLFYKKNRFLPLKCIACPVPFFFFGNKLKIRKGREFFFLMQGDLTLCGLHVTYADLTLRTQPQLTVISPASPTYLNYLFYLILLTNTYLILLFSLGITHELRPDKAKPLPDLVLGQQKIHRFRL